MKPLVKCESASCGSHGPISGRGTGMKARTVAARGQYLARSDRYESPLCGSRGSDMNLVRYESTLCGSHGPMSGREDRHKLHSVQQPGANTWQGGQI